MNPSIWTPLLLSLKVAGWATIVILPPGILLGRLLARRVFPGKSLVETLVALPLVLPPTAVGYVLLRLLSRDGPLGTRALGVDLDLLFTWKGAALSSAISGSAANRNAMARSRFMVSPGGGELGVGGGRKNW